MEISVVISGNLILARGAIVLNCVRENLRLDGILVLPTLLLSLNSGLFRSANMRTCIRVYVRVMALPQKNHKDPAYRHTHPEHRTWDLQTQPQSIPRRGRAAMRPQ